MGSFVKELCACGLTIYGVSWFCSRVKFTLVILFIQFMTLLQAEKRVIGYIRAIEAGLSPKNTKLYLRPL